MKTISLLRLLPCLLVPAAWADKSTAFNIRRVNCSTNKATIEQSTCGTNGQGACEMGERVTVSGYYTVKNEVPTEVEVCGKVQVFGIKVYNAGCTSVNICDKYVNW